MEAKTASKRKKQLNRKQLLILVIMLCVMLLMLISFAWFYFKVDKEVGSESADVMAPYYLYLLDGEGDNLSLSIGSLHPGETKQVIIGVSNKPAGELGTTVDYLVGKNSQFDYKLALAYTQNLPVIYTVYELKEQDDTDTTEGTTQTFKVKDPVKGEISLQKGSMTKDDVGSKNLTEANNKEMYSTETAEDESVDEVVNYVQYDLYPNDSANTPLCLATTVSEGKTSYEMDYYLIEIEWKEDITFQNFIKETDLVYVIVDAVQPKPEEDTE